MQGTETFEENVQQWYDSLPKVAEIKRPHDHLPETLAIVSGFLYAPMQIKIVPNAISLVFKIVNGNVHFYPHSQDRIYSMKDLTGEQANQNLDIVLFGKALNEREMPHLVFALKKDIPQGHYSPQQSNFQLRTIPLDMIVGYRI